MSRMVVLVDLSLQLVTRMSGEIDLHEGIRRHAKVPVSAVAMRSWGAH